MNVVVLVGLLVTLATAVPVALQLRAHPSGLTVIFHRDVGAIPTTGCAAC